MMYSIREGSEAAEAGLGVEPDAEVELVEEAEAVEDHDYKYWDGMWSVRGHNNMFLTLDNEDFLEGQLQDFLEDQQKDNSLAMAQEFLNLDFVGEDDESWFRLHEELLHPRDLHLCDGVIHRVGEEFSRLPPRLRIRKLPKTDMDLLMEIKVEANQQFARKQFPNAIALYEEALRLYMPPQMFVGPKDQMDQLVNILSNLAECYLRMQQYHVAGEVATNALLMDNNHEKSRMRRAKAELAIRGLPALVQAELDLHEIMGDDEHYSRAGRKQAQEYLVQVEKYLELERKISNTNHPTFDWVAAVRELRSRCW